MNLKDYGSEIRTYILSLTKDQLDKLLADSGVRIEESREVPEMARFTCMPSPGMYRLSSAYRVRSDFRLRVA